MNTEIYHDLCREIEILEIRIRDLEAEYRFWYKKGCHGHLAPLNISLDRMKDICDQVEMYSHILEEKKKARDRIVEHMKMFEGLENKIAYMREIEGKSLLEISMELGYSYSWIRKLGAKIRRKGTKKEQTG